MPEQMRFKLRHGVSANNIRQLSREREAFVERVGRRDVGAQTQDREREDLAIAGGARYRDGLAQAMFDPGV
jgi:hypothetical protein